MRANGKSTYQIKKEKLQKIKKLILELNLKVGLPWEDELRINGKEQLLAKIWEIVKDE